MQPSTTKCIIIFIAGLAIGIAGMAIFQAQQTPKSLSTTSTAADIPVPLRQQGPVTSAKDILAPDNAVEGVVQSTQDDVLTVRLFYIDEKGEKITTDTTKNIKVFNDTQILMDGIDNPPFSTIAVNQQITASGTYNDNGVLLAKYLSATIVK